MAPGTGTSAGAILALLAAVSWGGGDFAGGMGSKAAGGSLRGTLRVLVVAHTVSLAILTVWLILHGHAPLRGWPLVWGLGSGVVAGLAISAFYLALARGAMGAPAAVSGLLAAAIPAAVGIALEGQPRPLRLAGFVVAAAAIWLVAGAAPGGHQRPGAGRGPLGLALAGGVGFGVYFLGLRFANGLGVAAPVVLARAGSLMACLALYLVLGWRGTEDDRWQLSRAGWEWSAGVAVLDTGGNLLYLAATRAGRLDVAAVLASLYPASTIALAAGVLNERLSPRQMLGMGVAAAAAVMITL